MQYHHIDGLGARTFKTVLAVSICLIMSKLANQIGISSLGFYAATAAIITMQSSIVLSRTVGIQRAVGTVIGGIITIILLYIQLIYFDGYHDTIFAIIGTLLTLFVCTRLKIPLGVSTATVIVLSGFVLFDVAVIIPTITLRVLETILGVVIALVINQLILPPPMEEEILNETN
jgi:uncharacterized membrane protein YgaE (UPF0421/DUF939 family)